LSTNDDEGMQGCETSNRLLDFGDDLNHNADPGIYLFSQIFIFVGQWHL